MPADFLQAVHVMLSVAAKAAKMFSKHVIEFPAGICRRYSTKYSLIPKSPRWNPHLENLVLISVH
jgi:hypothetical protein